MSARGRCQVCGRELPVRRDGNLREHKRWPTRVRCIGSGRPPITEGQPRLDERASTEQARSGDLLRWHVHTERLRPIATWAPSAEEAAEKIRRYGLPVERVEPAPSARWPAE